MKKIFAIILAFLLPLCSCAAKEEEVFDENFSSKEEAQEEEPFRSAVSAPEYFYEFREGTVKYSSIDPESDFAESAAEFVKKYLEKTYSENEKIESFEITDVEVDMNTTNWWVNLCLYGETLKNNDVLNNFLVIRHRSNIQLKEGVDNSVFPDHDLNEPVEGHRFVVYDTENNYDYTGMEGYDWKCWNSDSQAWRNNTHTEEKMFDVFYARKNEHLPIYTNLKENSELSVLAAEYIAESMKKDLEGDPNILKHKILDIKANINQTNWYINTLQRSNYPVSVLENYVVCVSYKWTMDVSENAEISSDSFAGGFFYEFDNEIIERSVYLLYDCGEWIELDSSSYSFNAFDDLTEEKLIGAISSMH